VSLSAATVTQAACEAYTCQELEDSVHLHINLPDYKNSLEVPAFSF
jgi:hypothetical protein